jgi:hypothetical protein
MQQVLGTTSLAAEALKAANKECDQSLNSLGASVVLTAANAICLQKRGRFGQHARQMRPP